MMNQYDEKLNRLREQIVRKRHLDSRMRILRAQQDDLTYKVKELEAKKQSEQADVDRLEGRSLAVFFYRVFGSLDEKLSKEQEEAYAAAVKYDAAVSELAAVEEDIRRYGGEAYELRNCEAEYDAVLKEKADAIKASGSPEGEEMLRLENAVTALESRKKELSEAIAAGERASSVADSVLSELDDAESWGTWDMLGGGFIADVVKHSRLDDAQARTEQLQVALRRFKTELADVTIQADMQVNVDGFLRFADYFFDGLLADWTVMERIADSQSQVRSVKNQIRTVQKKLHDLSETTEGELSSIKTQLNELVLKVTV